jgi:hypothetical protein
MANSAAGRDPRRYLQYLADERNAGLLFPGPGPDGGR